VSDWSDDFGSDLEKISHKDFSNLSFAKFSRSPSDPSLRFQFDFIRLLDVFEQNHFTTAREYATNG
jgi:hypothetical protein